MSTHTTLLTEFLKRPIAYHAVIAKAFGSAKLAIFWSQLYYWHDKGDDAGGWIRKDQAEWYDETGLSRREQETARRLGVNLGLWEEKLFGNPATMNFRIDLVKSFELIETYISSHQEAPRRAKIKKPVNEPAAPAIVATAEPTPRQRALEFFAKGPIYQNIVQNVEANLAPDKVEIVENELEKFIDWWTERTPDGKRQLWQTKKTFEVNLRLKNWLRRCQEFQRIGAKKAGMIL